MLAYNSGAAFSFLSDAGGWQRWLLTAFSSAISVIDILDISATKTESLAALPLSHFRWRLGQFIRQDFDGYVVDFISVYYKLPFCNI